MKNALIVSLIILLYILIFSNNVILITLSFFVIIPLSMIVFDIPRKLKIVDKVRKWIDKQN